MPKYLTTKKPGHKYDPPCPKEVSLKDRMGFGGEKVEKKKVKKKSKKKKGAKAKEEAVLKKPAAAPGPLAKRKPWHKLRITNARKPERSYITGCHKGETKMKLIVEVSRKRSENYQEIITWLQDKLQEEHLTKEEVLNLRDETC